MIRQNIIQESLRNRLSIVIRRQLSASTSSASASEEPREINNESENDETSMIDENEPRIAELRDISRMRPWHRSIANGEPPSINTFKWQKERWALKERFATYGRASGVDPAILWPTREELDEIRQEDEELHPKFETTMAESRRIKEEKQKQLDAKRAEVERKAAEYPKILEAYRNKLREQQRAIDDEKNAKDEKVKEIQSYFGYAIDVVDPRFAAMMAKKEMEEKTMKRKELKRQRELDALRQIEEETKLLKQREQSSQIQTSVEEIVGKDISKAKAKA